MIGKKIYKKRKYLFLEYDSNLFNKWSVQPNRQESDMDPSIHHKVHTNDSHLMYKTAMEAGKKLYEEGLYFKEFDPYEFGEFELDEFKFDFEK